MTSIRVGTGFDAHRFEEGRPLVLGGVTVPGSPGLAGHSDADVLCHAVIDAVLGAVGDGDIGRHFPDRSAEWKGACSLDLLRRVAARLTCGKVTVVNVDSTVVTEAPKIAPHVEAMRRNLGAALGIPFDRVSVKGKTTEGMGFTGRGEGIAAMAVALVEVG